MRGPSFVVSRTQRVLRGLRGRACGRAPYPRHRPMWACGRADRARGRAHRARGVVGRVAGMDVFFANGAERGEGYEWEEPPNSGRFYKVYRCLLGSCGKLFRYSKGNQHAGCSRACQRELSELALHSLPF